MQCAVIKLNYTVEQFAARRRWGVNLCGSLVPEFGTGVLRITEISTENGERNAANNNDKQIDRKIPVVERDIARDSGRR